MINLGVSNHRNGEIRRRDFLRLKETVHGVR